MVVPSVSGLVTNGTPAAAADDDDNNLEVDVTSLPPTAAKSAVVLCFIGAWTPILLL